MNGVRLITPDISGCDFLAPRSTWCLATSGLQLRTKCVKALPALAMGMVAAGGTRLPCSSPGRASVKVLGKVRRVGDPKPAFAVFACVMITHIQRSSVVTAEDNIPLHFEMESHNRGISGVVRMSSLHE